jgi:hypothetical protein
VEEEPREVFASRGWTRRTPKASRLIWGMVVGVAIVILVLIILLAIGG